MTKYSTLIGWCFSSTTKSQSYLGSEQHERVWHKRVTLVDKHIISIQKSHARDLCLPFAFTCQPNFKTSNCADSQHHDF